MAHSYAESAAAGEQWKYDDLPAATPRTARAGRMVWANIVYDYYAVTITFCSKSAQVQLKYDSIRSQRDRRRGVIAKRTDVVERRWMDASGVVGGLKKAECDGIRMKLSVLSGEWVISPLFCLPFGRPTFLQLHADCGWT
jgi:hypothetical protein